MKSAPSPISFATRGSPLFRRGDAGLPKGRFADTADFADAAACDEHARTDDTPLFDGATQYEIVVPGRTRIAHGGEAGPERQLRGIGIGRTGPCEMNVRIDESRQERRARRERETFGCDDLRCVGGGFDGDDAAVANDHGAVVEISASAHVEHARCDDDEIGRGLLHGRRGRCGWLSGAAGDDERGHDERCSTNHDVTVRLRASSVSHESRKLMSASQVARSSRVRGGETPPGQPAGRRRSV
jgi:hypothetical protein